jgi:hypothetical protein
VRCCAFMIPRATINAMGTPLRQVSPKAENGSAMLWRYFKPSRFTEFLSTGKIYFASAREFADKFEGATAVLPPDLPVDPRYKGLAPADKVREKG